MKSLLIILAMLVAPYEIYGATSHFIDTNVYVVDGPNTYSLYESQKMSKKFFDIMSKDDKVFKHYKFNQISFVNVYIPNNHDKKQRIVIGLTNKKLNVVDSNFFSFYAPTTKRDQRIFGDNVLASLSIKYVTLEDIESQGYVTEAKW